MLTAITLGVIAIASLLSYTPNRPSPTKPAGVLILYDTTGEYGYLGELYAIQTANLVSHFEQWSAAPVIDYRKEEYKKYKAVIYIGSTYDEPIPSSFLDDAKSITTAGSRQILWIDYNLWKMRNSFDDMTGSLGFSIENRVGPVATVQYKSTKLIDERTDGFNVAKINVTDPSKSTVIANATLRDGSTTPWGVRSKNLTYIADQPFGYATPDSQYIAFSDILFSVLAPDTKVRHRALVRIEDVGPKSDPSQLRDIADLLYSNDIPFSVAVYPKYADPNGVYNNGTPVGVELQDSPDVVSALKYMVDKGGELVMHGYTHQYKNQNNPYNGVSSEDFEFYAAHVDDGNAVVLDGPVADDSDSWALGRLASAQQAWERVGLPKPVAWEFPHYAASQVDYQAISSRVPARYDRGLYFSGQLSGQAQQPRSVGQFFPYLVHDVYGADVIPENLGNVQLEAYNQHASRGVQQIVDSARRQLVVRDNVASFFYHPFLGTGKLSEIINEMKDMGYTFVSASSVNM